VHPDASELSGYQTVIAPSLASISDADAQLLDGYIAAGGNLIVTGAEPAMLNEYGDRRSSAALSLLLSSSAGNKVVHIPELLGKSYLTSKAATAGPRLSEAIREYIHSPIHTDADKTVHMELRRLGNELLLHLIDPEHLWNKKTPRRRIVNVSLEVPPNAVVTDVQLTSPKTPENLASNRMRWNAGNKTNRLADAQIDAKVSAQSENTAVLPYHTDGNRVSFQVPLEAYGMVVISLEK
jgi:hypothetical protein